MSAKSKKSKQRRIIFNNDGELSLHYPDIESPMSVEDLVDNAIKPLTGTHVDTLFWCVGFNVFNYNSKVAEKFGENMSSFPNASWWRRYENVKKFIEENNDPPKVIVEHGHKEGLEVFISLRMNDCHADGGIVEPRCKLKLEHPEYLLSDKGPFNYACPEVRNYWLAIIEEVCELYDIDGIEMDFQRHPRYFKEDEADKNIDLMNDFVRQARTQMDEIGKKKGHKLDLAVKVPPTFGLALKICLDIRIWLKERLIDILIASTQDVQVDLPVEEFVKAAKGTDCQVFACIAMGCWHSFHKPSIEMLRARALNYWRAGVDGIYVFNFNYIPLQFDPSWNYEPLREIGNPEVIANKDKHYFVYQMVKDAYRSTADPPQQLPKILANSPDETAKITFNIGDDIKTAVSKNLLSEIKLKLCITNLTSEDKTIIKLNNNVLLREQATVTIPLGKAGQKNPYWLEFSDINLPIRQGENELEIVTQHRNPKISGDLVLTDVEVIINYKK